MSPLLNHIFTPARSLVCAKWVAWHSGAVRMMQAIFVTPDGYVAEASNANLGIVTAERDLIVSPVSA